MKLSTALFSSLLVGAFVVAPVLSQDQPGQGRGQGFRGGRGPGLGMGRGFRNHSESSDEKADAPSLQFPIIAEHGGVVRLPESTQQPRVGTKLLVDLTSGSDVSLLNAGLEKVAKYVNLYAGGGAEPVEVKIAVVFHGDATLSVLNAEAYTAKFNTDGNPNLKLLQQLHEAGVEMYVCGQTLIAKGSAPNDVAAFVKTAVSALTAVVNLQSDGYAYVPIVSSSSSVMPTPQARPTDVVESNKEANSQATVGRGMGHGMGRGLGATQEMQGDMTTLHAMFADRDKIQRTVTNLSDGAEAITESDDETIANLLKEHVPAMEDRVLGNNPLPPMTFHPIFVELIKHAEDYTLTYEETEKGIKVKYQANDPYVVMLVQEHAKLVSRFIKNGMEEIHTPYTLPNISKETRK
jgi:intracellular sulfur oxidation DsrE/DsrF family protein